MIWVESILIDSAVVRYAVRADANASRQRSAWLSLHDMIPPHNCVAMDASKTLKRWASERATGTPDRQNEGDGQDPDE